VPDIENFILLKLLHWYQLPSMLWHCWLGGRKSIRPVKNESWGTGMVIGYLSGARCRFAYGPSHTTVFCSRKSRLVLVLPFWYRLIRVLPDKIRRAIKWL